MPRIYTGGTFDLFHAGHVEFLRRCATVGDVWISLNTDEFATRYKRKPVLTFEERFKVLESCKYVTEVIRNYGDEDSKPAIEYVNPKYIAHGDDWVGDSLEKQMGITGEWLDDRGIGLLYIAYYPKLSTSEIIERICSCSRLSEPLQEDTRIPSRFCIACS